ncbi:MAG: hypothetical protein OEY33_07760 [Bdellovibrionales bacterium]|jgi:hypothetical protein|nr:hypothetical protein [Bdellovibrionales bacterium]
MKKFILLTIFFITCAQAQDENPSEKYPQIKEVLNNPQLGEEGKCPTECQAKQLDCYNSTEPEQRDKCVATYNECLSSCGGAIGGTIDPEYLKNPSAILDDLDVDPELIKQVINAAEGRGVESPSNPNTAPDNNQGIPSSSPPPSPSSPVSAPAPSVTEPI